MTESDSAAQTLSEKFEEALNIHLDLKKSTESSSCPSYQSHVEKAISLFEDATRMVNELCLFSRNEDFEEISTPDLKYLLLPALLGNLTAKLTSKDRLQLIETSETYFKDYLSRIKDYGICDVRLPESEKSSEDAASVEAEEKKPQDSLASLEAMALKRRAKIMRYNKQKELEVMQRTLKARMETGSADDETVREYYSVLLQSWVNSALEELESIKMEKPILKHLEQLKLEQARPEKKAPKPNPLKPVIITRNEMQKQVLGVGYPSLPILTVDEFYEKRYGEHEKDCTSLPSISLQKMAEDPEQTAREIEEEDAEKEEKFDKEDPDTIQRERNWDDWKDEHRRGWGNRHNMG